MSNIETLTDFQILAGIIALTPEPGEAGPVPLPVALDRLHRIAEEAQQEQAQDSPEGPSQ